MYSETRINRPEATNYRVEVKGRYLLLLLRIRTEDLGMVPETLFLKDGAYLNTKLLAGKLFVVTCYPCTKQVIHLGDYFVYFYTLIILSELKW